MQKFCSKKWLLLFTLVLALVMIGSACTANNPNSNRIGQQPEQVIPEHRLTQGNHEIEGHIVAWNRQDGTVTIDQVEFLTTQHHDRIQALGLNRERDFRHGYYVHNLNRETVTLPVAANLQVRLADRNRANDWAEGLRNRHDGYSQGINRRQGDGVAYPAYNGVSGRTNGIIDGYNDAAYSGRVNSNDQINNAYGINDGGMARGTYGRNNNSAYGRIGEAARDMGNNVVHAVHGIAGGMVGGIELLSGRYTDGTVNSSQRALYFFTIENGRVTSITDAHAYHNYNPHYTNRGDGLTTGR